MFLPVTGVTAVFAGALAFRLVTRGRDAHLCSQCVRLYLLLST